MKWVLVGFAAIVAFLVVKFVRALGDIHACAGTGRAEKILELLAKNPKLLRATNSEGEIPVHQAAKYGQIEALKLLLDKGSDINAKTPQGVTPLHLAANFGELEAVKLLLERGAEPDPKEETGMTPIMAAQGGNHQEIIKLLKAAGADDTAVPAYGQMGGNHFVSPMSDSAPLMLKATEKARATLDTLRSLYKQSPRDAMVKVPFRTDSGNLEHLWGEVVDLTSEKVRVRIRTMPNSHNSKFEKVQERPIADIEDWQFQQRDGSIRGGFGYQVLFLRMREKTGGLPRQWAENEKRFVDHDVSALSGEGAATSP